METIFKIFEVVAGIGSIITVSAIFIKPIRERIFNTKKANDGERCLLRSEILRIYYKGLPRQELHQYEAENLARLYEAYKALGGNSFVDSIYSDMINWTVVR